MKPLLQEWLDEVRSKRPLSKLEVMEREMESAIGKEMYERAAELRAAGAKSAVEDIVLRTRRALVTPA